MPAGVLGGEISHHRSPGTGRSNLSSQLTQKFGRDMELDYPALAGIPPRPRPLRTAAGNTSEDQVALGVGDGETPLRPVSLISDQATGYAGQHRAKPWYVAASFIQPEQGGQTYPDLDPGSRRAPATQAHRLAGPLGPLAVIGPACPVASVGPACPVGPVGGTRLGLARRVCASACAGVRERSGVVERRSVS